MLSGGNDALDLGEAHHVLQVIHRAVVIAVLHRDGQRPRHRVEGNRQHLVTVGGGRLKRGDDFLGDLQVTQVHVLKTKLSGQANFNILSGDFPQLDQDDAKLLALMGGLLRC